MQLKDFNIENIKAAISLKADFLDQDNDRIIFQNDIDEVKRGIRVLLLTEPSFFLMDDFLDTALLVSKTFDDNFSSRKLLELQNLKEEEKENKFKDYIYQEQLRRSYRFTKLEYQELLELDDMLLREAEYNYAIESDYILYSITYLKTQFSEYYNQNKMADIYLFTILRTLIKDSTIDNEALTEIASTMDLFDDDIKEGKIITFSKKIKE